MKKFFRSFWKPLGAVAALIGILYLPADIKGLPDALGMKPGAIRAALEAFMSIERETWLIGFSFLLVLWIVWIDARPFVLRWLQAHRTSIFSVMERVHQETYRIKELPEIYLHKYYIAVRNNRSDGKTIKGVQARLSGYDAPILCSIKGHPAEKIDLRHGEWAFFEIGRMASKELGMMKGSVDIGQEYLKTYKHNVPQGYLSFELWSFPNNREFGLGSGSDDGSAGEKTVWPINMVISADDIKSERLVINVDFTADNPRLTFERII